jgi:hypothetical protein
MKTAACGTWLGDLITALMVTDMMLQDNLYPQWASCFRQIWRRSNIPRILIFWVGSVVATSVVVTLIVSDWISWDKLNRDFVATTGKGLECFTYSYNSINPLKPSGSYMYQPL